MKKLLGLTALALSVFGCHSVKSTINNISIESIESNTRTPIENQPLKQAEINKFTSRERIYQSYTPILYQNAGIPPKQYGMYHVRKGTHKRTNI